MLQSLSLYLQYDFVRRALLVGVLIAVCAALLGNVLIHKRLSFLGDGLSHVAFGAFSMASVLPLTNKMPLILGITLAAAVFLLRTERRASGDALLSVLSVGILALGYLALNLFSPTRNLSVDVSAALFGAAGILTLTREEAALCVFLTALTIGGFGLFHNRIFALTFDKDFARAMGLRTARWRRLFALTAAMTVVLAMRLAGALLITALTVFPPVSAMRLCGSFRGVLLLSAILAAVSALLGILLAVMAGWPVGATVVIVNLMIFGFCSLMGRKG